MILNCQDKQVRSHISQTILHTINIIISFYKLELNLQKPNEKDEFQLYEDSNYVAEFQSEEDKKKAGIEEMIINFLNVMISIMPNEVAKNWTKFQQYFEFWKDFAYSGESQISFLFQKQFIAILIDFFLEKKSPIPEFSEKKYSMGNRYVEPAFDPLIQTLELLVRRSSILIRISQLPRTSFANQGFKVIIY